MSLAEFQACLARLYVDQTFRDLLKLNAPSAFGQYELSDQERICILQIDWRMLELYANSVTENRHQRVRRAYPATFALGISEVNRYFARYHQLHPMIPYRKVLTDLVDFGNFIEYSVAGNSGLPKYASEVARFERLHLEARGKAGTKPRSNDQKSQLSLSSVPCVVNGIEVIDFQYDVLKVCKRLHQGGKVEEIDCQEGTWWMIFQPANGSVEVHRIGDATRLLLLHSDGTHDVRYLVAAVGRELGLSRLEDEVLSTLQKLIALRVCTII